ncbi:MAG TPA: hypothetical protein PLR43_05000 [Syntrophales bacterium]|nr:hypothetical protein [Syntrophales bacterium]
MGLGRVVHQKPGQPGRTVEGRGEAEFEAGRDETRAVRQGSGGSGREGLLVQALARANMVLAWRRVKANRGSAGVDGRTIAETAEYLKTHWPHIREALLDGSYRPEPVRRVQIPKSGGGVRELGIPTVTDRLIQQALLQVMQPRNPASRPIDPGVSKKRPAMAPFPQKSLEGTSDAGMFCFSRAFLPLTRRMSAPYTSSVENAGCIASENSAFNKSL